MPIKEVNGGPRYTYGGPDKKAMPGMPENKGTKISNYKLPATDVQESLHNFDGYQVEQFFSLEDIRQGDTSGTTETDSKTASKSGGYTKINEKSGKAGRNWNSSSPRR